MRVVSKRPMVDHPTPSFQEDEVVKVLEEDSTRLMDGAKNGLARVSELAEEADHVESCVRIQS